MKSNNTRRENLLYLQMEKRQFELKWQMSLIWLVSSFQSYRAAEIIAERASNARNKSVLRESNDEATQNGMVTLEEELDLMDQSAIIPSFYLLARSIELLIKAIIIEQNNGTQTTEKLIEHFKNRGHNLAALLADAKIKLTKPQNKDIRLLDEIVDNGIYPVTWTVKDLKTKREAINSSSKNYSVQYYDGIANLYDVLLKHLNRLRHINNRKQYPNPFKIQNHP